jgi:ferric-dicitrate binding protein FerR (iron transport regulator)
MTCSEVEARLVDLVDGWVDPVASVRVHAHIEGCAACRGRAALWRKLVPGMRDLEPSPPTATAVRRMQLEVERLVVWEAPAALRRRPSFWRPALIGLAGAAAAVSLWLGGSHLRRHPATPAVAESAFTEPASGSFGSFGSFGSVAGWQGSPTVDGRPLAGLAGLASGSEIAVPTGSRIDIDLARGAHLRLDGPARAVLGGTPRDVAIGLAEGTVQAEVDHRRADETFAIQTRDLRVEVRGTRFAVGAGAEGSWVRVAEGRVAVRFSDGHQTFVSTGESVRSTPAPAPEAAQTPTPTGCGETVRSCEGATRAARLSMRGGDTAHALRLVAAASRAMRGADQECGDEAGGAACEDELRYLRAEALHEAGRLDEAIAAYRTLDRRGAPAATRQNALYAAAQIEERRGLSGRARADYQRALTAAPRGALCEEALVGAMESARAAGDLPGARALAARYLAQFPGGLHMVSAQRLAGAGSGR